MSAVDITYRLVLLLCLFLLQVTPALGETMDEPNATTAQSAYDLGYPVVCLNVADLAAAVDFYLRLGFCETGGARDENWAVLSHPAVELRLFQGHIDANALLFTGCDPGYHSVILQRNGLFDPPPPPVPLAPSTLAGADGEEDLCVTDPAGQDIYYIAGPGQERADTGGKADQAGPGSYGTFTWAVPLKDVAECVAFYRSLGFTVVEEDVADDYKWIELAPPGDPTFRICFCENVTPGQMLMFLGGDVYATEQYLMDNGLTPDIPAQLGNDGVDSMMVRDPDGNMVCFHGPPPE